MTIRLINRTDVLSQLRATIAAVPAGERLHIPALRDALINQGDVIKGIETLIAANELDPRTLRPPAKVPRLSLPPKAQPGAPLLAEIEAFCADAGMSVSRFGKDALNDFGLVNRLRKGARVTQSTIARARAFIAGAACPDATAPRAVPRAGHGGEEPPKTEQAATNSPPPAPIETQGSAAAQPTESGSAPAKSAGEPVAKPPPPPAPVTVCPPSREFRPSGRQLADELTAYAQRHSLSLHRVARFLFNGPGAIGRLRASATPRQSTIDKVRAFLAVEPPAELAVQPAGDPRVADVGGVTGAELADQVGAVIEKHGLSKSRVGLLLYNNRHGVDVLRQSNPRRSTVAKVRAFLANPPIDELRRARGPLGDRRFAENRADDPPPGPCGPTGAELAAEIDDFIARTGVKAGRVSNLLFTSGTGIAQLRRVKAPKPETVEKVRLFLERPPDELFAPRRPFNGAPRASAAAKPRRDPSARSARDLTREPPVDPQLDLADRQRLNGQRHQANIRRAQEREALAKLEKGEAPKNSFEKTLMGHIGRRQADEARQTDPLEQAKLVLQKRYRPVCSMAVYGGDPNLFVVGSKRDLTREQLLDMAGEAVSRLFPGQTARTA